MQRQPSQMNAPAKAVKPKAARAGKPARPPRPRWARITLKILKWGTLAGLLLLAIGVATMAILFAKYDKGLPQISTLRDYKPKQVTRIYSADDQRVVAPVAIQQALPKYPGRIRPGGMTGVVEVVINEMGLVDTASTIVSLGTAYDELVTAAATRWQYYPARVDGKPVKFRKRIQITVAAQPGV